MRVSSTAILAPPPSRESYARNGTGNRCASPAGGGPDGQLATDRTTREVCRVHVDVVVDRVGDDVGRDHDFRRREGPGIRLRSRAETGETGITTAPLAPGPLGRGCGCGRCACQVAIRDGPSKRPRIPVLKGRTSLRLHLRRRDRWSAPGVEFGTSCAPVIRVTNGVLAACSALPLPRALPNAIVGTAIAAAIPTAPIANNFDLCMLFPLVGCCRAVRWARPRSGQVSDSNTQEG